MMRIKIPLVGGEYDHPSTPFDRQATINMYPEAGGTNSKAPSILRRFPGLKLFKTIVAGAGQIRPKGMYETSSNRLFVVRADKIIEITAGGAESVIGAIPSTSGPVSMTDNGEQLVVADGAAMTLVDLITGAVSVVTDVDAPINTPMVDTVDGYIFGFDPDSLELGKFQHSELVTGGGAAAWLSTDSYFAENVPDKMVALIAQSGKIWVWGTKSLEVFYNTGANRGTWTRLPGTPKDIGCGAPHSVAKMSNRVFWLGSSKEGRAIVYMSGEGYSAVEISTKPLESWINSIEDVSDAIGFTMQIQGHFLYMLTFQKGDRTYCFDLTTGEWFRVSYRNTTTGHLGRSRIVAHAFFDEKNLTGDYAKGLLYELDNLTFDDNGDPQVCDRYFPYFQDTKNRMFWKSLQIDIETGVGLTDNGTNSASSVDPKIQLRWSDDGGRTFKNWHQLSFGKIGEYLTRVKINRLGWSRDRVFHLRCSAPVPFSIIDDAFAEVRIGKS